MNCLYMITCKDITFKFSVSCRGTNRKIQRRYETYVVFLPAHTAGKAVRAICQFNPQATNVIYIYAAPILDVSRSHTMTQHSRQDSSGRAISSSQRPLPDNTRHSQQTNIHAPGGIRTQDLSRRATAVLLLLLLLLLPLSSFFQALNFLAESFGLLNKLFPFPSILDAGYPVLDLQLADVLFDVILPFYFVISCTNYES